MFPLNYSSVIHSVNGYCLTRSHKALEKRLQLILYYMYSTLQYRKGRNTSNSALNVCQVVSSLVSHEGRQWQHYSQVSPHPIPSKPLSYFSLSPPISHLLEVINSRLYPLFQGDNYFYPLISSLSVTTVHIMSKLTVKHKIHTLP